MKTNEQLIKDSLKLIESMVEEGFTDKEIAEKIGMSYTTFRRYKSQNKELKDVIVQGKDKKNQKVEQSLYKCCNGYSYTEEVVTKVKEEFIEEGQKIVKENVKISKVKKYKGPDLLAQKYWLNNKKKATWKEDPNKAKYNDKVIKLKEKELENKEW